MIARISLVGLLCLASPLQGDLVQNLPFPVQVHGMYRPAGRFFVGAATRVPKNALAVAVAERSGSNFIGLTPERIILNRRADQPNPLNGAAINHLALLDRRAVVIPDTVPVSLYLIEDRAPQYLIQSAPLRDSNGAIVPSVLALTTTAANVLMPLDAGDTFTLGAIAAVPNQDGGFDGNGSGIALAWYRQIVNEKKNLKYVAWDIVNALTGASSFTKEGDATDMLFAARTVAAAKRGRINLAWLGKKSNRLTANAIQQKVAPKPVQQNNDDGSEKELEPQERIYLNPLLFGKKPGVQQDEADETALPRTGNKAASFGKDTAQLMINVPASAIASAVDLHFDRELGRLYIATQVTAGEGAQAGARAIVVASLANGFLQYHKLAPDSAFDTENRIVGKRGSGSITKIYKVRTMQTRTYLRYLIVVGGNGEDPSLEQSVYALPLVDKIKTTVTEQGSRVIDLARSTEHGTLAKVDSTPVTEFRDTPPQRFQGRRYDIAAQAPSDLYTMTSPQARVGGNVILPGPISDIEVSTEAIFVSCTLNEALNQEQLAAGMFYSQPVFDSEGRISGWTDWQRVANASVSVEGFGYDPLGLFWFIPSTGRLPASAMLASTIPVSKDRKVAPTESRKALRDQIGSLAVTSDTNKKDLVPVIEEVKDRLHTTRGRTGTSSLLGTERKHGQKAAHVDADAQNTQSTPTSTDIFRSKWTDGTDALSHFILRFFSKEKGGIQGLFDMPYTTSGFATRVDERLSVQILTGYKKVLILQTGKQQNGLFGPFEKYDDAFVRTDGMMMGFEKASSLVISGGALDTLGPISSAAVLSDGSTGWFVVGGAGGIALLADDQGHGWDAQQGLRSGFQGLSSSAEWKLISTTPFVRKLIVEDGQLFALSQGKLERIMLTAQSLAKNALTRVTLSELSDEQVSAAASYSDVYLKGPLALIATSFGLLRSGAGTDVCTGTSIPWITVYLPESVGSLTSSGPVSRIFAIRSSDPMGQDTLYILNGYVGLNQALIYRLVVSLDNGIVTDGSVTLFPDYFLKDTQSFFTNIGEYREYLVTDGALIALSRSSLDCAAPLLELLSPALKSGQSARLRAPFVTLPTNAGTVGLLVRSSASGAWMVPGDFGVRMQR